MADTQPLTTAAIRRLQQERDNFWIALRTIAKGYLPPDRLRAQGEKLYGLPGDEAIEYAYENVQQLASLAIKGTKKPKEPHHG